MLEAPSIVVIQDSRDQVFGAFAANPWKKRKGFFGTGETFLFKLEHIGYTN